MLKRCRIDPTKNEYISSNVDYFNNVLEGKTSLELYNDVNEDVFKDTLLQIFSKQICLKTNIEERTTKLGILCTTENQNVILFYQYST